MTDSPDPTKCLTAIHLDEETIGRGTPDQEHERAIAIYDILESNSFRVPGHDGGPYALRLAMFDSKLAFQVSTTDGAECVAHYLSLTPFRRVIKDYGLVCESYHNAIRSASPAQIEAIDMGRRGLHNEASELLIERLGGKLELDFDTARRLFTLLYALHWRG